MSLPEKWKMGWAVATACAFLLQSCATLVRGTSQEIPVTSHPAGARIIVDGKDMGVTPLSVRLARKRDHLIRIEQEGYVPLEIKALSKVSIGGGVFMGGEPSVGDFGRSARVVGIYYRDCWSGAQSR